MNPLLMINGKIFPDPDEYKMEIEPLGSFERNANGLLVGDLVAVKRKINCTWKILEGKYYSELIAAVLPFFIAVGYTLPGGESGKAEMYVSPQSGKLIFRKNGENWWGGVTLSLIER
jgi:hypothetical protein